MAFLCIALRAALAKHRNDHGKPSLAATKPWTQQKWNESEKSAERCLDRTERERHHSELTPGGFTIGSGRSLMAETTFCHASGEEVPVEVEVRNILEKKREQYRRNHRGQKT